MNRCPITYKRIDQGKYSAEGLRKLSNKITVLNDFPYSIEEQINEAKKRVEKMSIQGIQPKLSVVLDEKEQVFKVVDIHGSYIIKPQHRDYKEMPENEDLTMHLAKLTGIEIPLHGLVYSKDGSLSYFIKRFDRIGKKGGKVPVEDFAQLSGRSRETKYDSTMERIVSII